jgi:hypothetical protein
VVAAGQQALPRPSPIPDDYASLIAASGVRTRGPPLLIF